MVQTQRSLLTIAHLIVLLISTCGICAAPNDGTQSRELLVAAQSLFGQLNDTETEFIQNLSKRHEFRFRPRETTEGTGQLSEGDGQHVMRSALVSWSLLREEANDWLRGRRLTIEGVSFDGRFDMRSAQLAYPVTFRRCVFSKEIDLREATLGDVVFDRSTLAGIKAYRTTVNGTFAVLDCSCSGALDFDKGDVLGDFIVKGGSIEAHAEKAVSVAHCKISGNLLLLGPLSIIGRIDFSKAQIEGDVRIYAIHVTSSEEIAVNGWDARVGGDLSFNKAIILGTIYLGTIEVCGIIYYYVPADPRTELILEFAKARGLMDSEESWPPKGNLSLTGFDYELIYPVGLPPSRSRLDWLSRCP